MKKEDLQTLQQKVTLLRAEGKYKETIEASYNLLTYGIQLNDQKSILIAHINNAASFYCIGAIEEAFASIEAYDEVYSKHGDETDALHLYNVLFLLYEYKKDYARAKETLSKSIELGKQLKKFNIVSNGYSNYSHVCMKEDNFEDALLHAKKGLEFAKIHLPESRILEIRVTLNIAQSYIEIGDLGASKVFVDEIIHDPVLDSFIREKAQSYVLQGNWLSASGRFKEAFDSYTQAKELVESYNDIYLLKLIQEKRNDMCEKMQDIQLGYTVQKEYISLLTEINNRELALAAVKLEVKHNVSSIEKKANTDSLTGLYNRSYIERITNEWLEESNHNANIICIVFDIDRFKSINDVHGHLFGDYVIKQVAKACLSVIGKNEIMGRYGGDEFVIILRDVPIEMGKMKAKHIEAAVKNLKVQTEDGSLITLTTSIGVADNSNGASKNFEELFHAADQGLYEAKRNGKDQIIVMES